MEHLVLCRYLMPFMPREGETALFWSIICGDQEGLLALNQTQVSSEMFEDCGGWRLIILPSVPFKVSVEWRLHRTHNSKLYCGIDLNGPENGGYWWCVVCGWCLMFKTSHLQHPTAIGGISSRTCVDVYVIFLFFTQILSTLRSNARENS